MNILRGSRKAQMNTISGIGQIAIAIVIAAVILGLGGTILSKIQTTQTDASASHINETLAWAGNNTAIGLSENRIIESTIILYNNASIVNKGSGVAANYSTTSNSITIINSSGGPKGATGADWITTDLNVSYDYNLGSTARNATGFGKQGITTMAEFIPTIAIIAMAAIVIGIILVFFGRKKDEEVL